ncbi:SPL family radical SAM protein [Candidatus Viridilinea mediisalina]|uniref:Radical SAM protein n=1 Tax=Candidatus Viridilinea mediisalina TaxID=2024553 RepID=A0A2A6RMN7_9CHLR|nr:radical SAM protein [Candidatus Viridilinea mediisalina]PDW04148.1 radical SAM protein [Candidatus Viridilinea mediisalina]
MAYYIRDSLHDAPALSQRRPTINEFFLSSYTLSIYSGCELGCPYCDSWIYSDRPLNETISVPLDLPQRLAQELDNVDRGDLIAISALSDPYQPAEQTYRLTRQVLQVLADRGQPTLVLTKSATVLEDTALLQRINEQSLAIVMTTLLTADPHLAPRLEGKAPPPALRLEMLAELKRAGVPVGVALLPIMPYVNDTDSGLRSLLRACAAAQVDFVIWDYLHIPNERHRFRINEILARLGSYPASYYRDIYAEQTVVSSAYRQERDATIATRCNGLALELRAPHRLFAGRLAPRNEAALLLKHAAFRDRTSGRDHIATIQRELADQIYTGNIDPNAIKQTPLAPIICPLLGLEP